MQKANLKRNRISNDTNNRRLAVKEVFNQTPMTKINTDTSYSAEKPLSSIPFVKRSPMSLNMSSAINQNDLKIPADIQTP